MLNIVCVRMGDKYAPDYVAVLRDMVARNLAAEHRFWCVTDDPAGLPDDVTAIAPKDGLPGWWQKVALFAPDMPWARGERVVFLDLDVAITGRLDDLCATPGVIDDWHVPGFNSSVMVWDHGDHAEVWDWFEPAVMDRSPGDQDWITSVDGLVRATGGVGWATFPAEWCVSYRSHAVDWPPEGAVVVCFHGLPKPADIRTGWVADTWKIGGLTAFPKFDGMNVGVEAALDNVRLNCARDLEWFTGFGRRDDDEVAMVCGGPSLAHDLDKIAALKARGVRVVTVNNALTYLCDRGIKPACHVLLDARPDNAAFVADAPFSVRYFVASQCDPAVFRALKRRRVVVWHAAICDHMREVLAPWDDKRPIVLVGGGGTVGLRALNLCALSGYRRIHLFGMDGSYDGDVHHAYDQPLNAGETVVELRMGGRPYRCAVWMVRQAEEFKAMWAHLSALGVRLDVHGRGLIPDMASLLSAERIAA